MTSITNAASRENSAMREAIAYMGTISIILMTILFRVQSKRSEGDELGVSLTAGAAAFDNS